MDNRDQYVELAKSGITATEFCRRLNDDGVSKFDIFVLLRDEFDMNLMQCTTVYEQATSESNRSS